MLAFSAIISVVASAQVVELPITKVDGAIFYSHSDFSSPGAYDYYLGFSGSGDYGFPIFEMDVFMPTNQGLTAGTYTMADHKIGDILLIQNMDDYGYVSNNYDPYGFSEATMTITDMGKNIWQFEFSGTDAEGRQYHFLISGAVTYNEIKDGNGNSQPEVTYKYEPTQATTMNITFDRMEWNTSYIKDYHILDMTLYSSQKTANNRNYKAQIYFLTDTAAVPAGTYPINDSNQLNTFMASVGCSTTSNSLDYPSYLQTYNPDYVFDSWYMVGGSLSFGFTAEGKMTLTGSATTYNGSTININYMGDAPTGVRNILTDKSQETPRKLLTPDGNLRLNAHGREYNVNGVRVR